MDTQFVASENLANLGKNPYPGRGLIIGVDQTGEYITQVYWVMGRSANSRNRLFKEDGARVFTEAVDPSKMTDPSLVIYNAMDECALDKERVCVVSNGNHTDALIAAAREGRYLSSALQQFEYEPDAPHFTPRIAGWCSLGEDNRITLAALRKSADGTDCEHSVYPYDADHIPPGFGYCLTTYSGDGDPLPTFRKEPFLLPLPGGLGNIVRTYRSVLNDANMVSLAVKWISVDSKVYLLRIYNKYGKA